MIFHWSLSNSKSPQVSRTLLSILADLSNAIVWMVLRPLLSIQFKLCNAVVWMVSICPLIPKSSIPFTNPLGIVPCPPTTIDIAVTFLFHSFFSSLAISRYLSFFSSTFIYTQWSARTVKFTILQVLISFFFFFFFFCHCWLSLGLVV